MSTRTFHSTLPVVLLLAGACNAFHFGGGDLTPEPPPPSDSDPHSDRTSGVPLPAQDAGAPARTCPEVMSDPHIDYLKMCRHYCDTLDETLRYLVLSRGETPADAGTVSQQCYDMRCVPRCVDQALCFTQCDAAAMNYAAVCANADAGPDNTLCPSSTDDHLSACRAGCSPPAPTIDLE
jgi:hypothetical protein